MNLKNTIIKSSVKNDLPSFARGKASIHTKKYGHKKGERKNLRKGLTRFEEKKDKFKVRYSFKKFIKNTLFILGIFMIFGFAIATIGLIGIISSYSQNLPNIDEYFANSSTEGKESIIVDRNGKELYRLRGEKLMERVELKDIPQRLQWMFIATEDINFKNHKGVDFLAITRAVVCMYKSNGEKNCGGGSSITQQLVKKTTGFDDKTFDRKTKEAILAMRVEQKYTKDQILEFYFNIVPEGGVLQGVKSSSKYLYGKENLEDLTLAEMAYLVAIPNEPSKLSPWGGTTYDPKRSLERADYVLSRLYEVKDQLNITSEQIESAKKDLETVKFQPNTISKRGSHYTDYVIHELDKLFADKAGPNQSGSDFVREKGYKIVTTTDIDLQESLERSIKERVESQEFQDAVNAQNASAVIMDNRTGEILAMVGSRDYNATSDDPRFNPQFNASLSPRSLGSTMKPVLYLSAFRIGLQPNTIVPDYRLDLSLPGSQPYFPEDYGRTYSDYGRYITMRTALKYSLNVPAVATVHLAGLENYIDTYYRLNGWEGFKDYVVGPAAPLGAANMPLLEQVHAFSTLGAMGAYHEKKVILEIYDDKGNLIYNNKEVKSEQKINKKFIYLINDLNQHYWMFDVDPLLVQTKYTMDIAGKTGTGDRSDGRISDVAFVAYTPNISIGFWAGNSCGGEQCPLEGYSPTSENLYYMVAKPFMENYLPTTEPARFEKPDGISSYSSCRYIKIDEEDKDEKPLCIPTYDITALPPFDTIPGNITYPKKW